MKIIGFDSFIKEQLTDDYLKKWPNDIWLCEKKIPADISPNKSILVTEKNNFNNLNVALKNEELGHIINISHPFFFYEISIAANMIVNKQKFIDDPVSIFIESIKKPLEYWYYDFELLEEKNNILSKLSEKLRSLKLRNTIIDSIIFIADELFTNAVYCKSIENKKKLQAHLLFLFSFEQIFIGCIDNYGSLNINKFLNHVFCVGNEGSVQIINFDKGSSRAGIGSFLLFNICSGAYVGINNNEKTVIFYSLPIKLNTRKEQIPISLHLINR